MVISLNKDTVLFYTFYFPVTLHWWIVIFKSNYPGSRIQWLLLALLKTVDYVWVPCLALLHNFSHHQTYLQQGMAIPGTHTRDVQGANFLQHLGWLLPSLAPPHWGSFHEMLWPMLSVLVCLLSAAGTLRSATGTYCASLLVTLLLQNFTISCYVVLSLYYKATGDVCFLSVYVKNSI